ncbi:MAG TPA: hypothetical protein VFF82_01035 [Rhodocyclaceae bacterium]|nr:hypothetical protein [Rhodocyclaceae bacterium]
MKRKANISRDNDEPAATAIGKVLHLAMQHGLAVGRAVKIGAVRGVVIGYNISRRGRYPALRYPLLVETELGVAKFGLDEVTPA